MNAGKAFIGPQKLDYTYNYALAVKVHECMLAWSLLQMSTPVIHVQTCTKIQL